MATQANSSNLSLPDATPAVNASSLPLTLRASSTPSFIDTPSGQRTVQLDDPLLLDKFYPETTTPTKKHRQRSRSDSEGLNIQQVIGLTYSPNSKKAHNLATRVSMREPVESKKESLSFVSIKRPFIPLCAASLDTKSFYQVVVGHTILALIGKPSYSPDVFPATHFTKVGLFEVTFKNEAHLRDVNRLRECLGQEGAQVKVESNDFASKLTFQVIAEGLAFLALHCKLSSQQIRELLEASREIISPTAAYRDAFHKALKTDLLSPMNEHKDTTAFVISQIVRDLKRKGILKKDP
jgi:hypothetical protein